MKLSAAQKRALLFVLVGLVLLAGWRWRASRPSAPLPSPEETTRGLHAASRVELNTADTTQLQSVSGIGSTLARRIVRYRELSGGFTTTEQLLKVYGITLENFIRIEEQVYVDTTTPAFAALRKATLDLPSSAYPPRRSHPAREAVHRAAPLEAPPPLSATFSSSTPQPTKPAIPRPLLDINTADSAALVDINGIGPATARNIVKYRSLIFFYDNLDQLAEVWGVRPENLARMQPYLTVGGAKQSMPHLHVNTMPVEELGKHFYLGYKEARILVAYRDMHGPFVDFAAVQQVHGITPERLRRLEPYLVY